MNFVWSLHPSYRGDKMYEYILGHVFTETLDIPWQEIMVGTGARVRNDYRPATINILCGQLIRFGTPKA